MSDVRKVMSKTLSAESIARLNGAPVFDPEDLDDAIIDVFSSSDGDVAVYDYEKLCQHFYDGENPDLTWEHAMEWVDYNLVRALPYMNPRAPLIVMRVEKEDREEYGDDVMFFEIDNFVYVQL